MCVCVCRITGKVFSNEVCHRQLLIPDKGWYKPQRVFEGVVGLVSQDMREDLVLESEKKTEIVAGLLQYVKVRSRVKVRIRVRTRARVKG